jgi:hypothetical protein
MKKLFSTLSLFATIFSTSFAQEQKPIVTIVPQQKQITVAALMEKQRLTKSFLKHKELELDYPDRSKLPQNPDAPQVSSFPDDKANLKKENNSSAAFVLSTSFTGATLAETGSFPPDNMGAVGPTQFIVAVNGRIRSFNKTTGVADGVLNIDPTVFFSTVVSPLAFSFTSDPRIRYDRLSARWIIIIIDVPASTNTNAGTIENSCLIAVSNTSTITGATVWTFSKFLGQANTFFDYPTIGIDKNALYIGGNMFSLAGSFVGTNGYVINRASLLAGGAYSVNTFLNLCLGAGAGPFTPQGVDNFDANPTEGYFIGADNATFSTLMIRRVSTPGGTPTISGNISLTVPTTTSSATIPHLGNTGGTNGNLDGLDDRLFAAFIRGGHLWTTHSFRVSTAGVANTAATARNGCRWYDIQNLTTIPSLNQSGTVFDAAATNPRWYSIPTIMVSGQGHATFSLTAGGLADRANAATTVRFATDALGTTQAPVLTTASATAYNPPSDPGGTGGRRWGDYSYVSLDPKDDMTMWMVHEFCNANNSYGVNVTKVLAPLPATPTSCSPASVTKGLASVNVILTGTAVAGSGFYDPGANLAAPALAFNHIAASISGAVTVNSITYTDPTHITLNISTVGATIGTQTITVTNPDGQSANSAAGILTISAPLPIKLLSFSANKKENTSLLNWHSGQEINNKGFEIERSANGDFFNNNLKVLGFVQSTNSSNGSAYSFIDTKPFAGRNYYRLKQIDIDNSFSFSDIKVVDFSNTKISVYPNPFTGKIKVLFVADKSNYRIINAEGQVVLRGFVTNGEIDGTKLSKGLYTLQLLEADKNTEIKIIKK